MKRMNSKKLVTLALLSACALVIFTAEAQIPVPIPVPGLKLGLSNVILLLTLRLYGRRSAAAVLLLKTVLGAAVCGSFSSFLYSAAGGLLAFTVMALLTGPLRDRQLWALSAFGAIAHNAGQLVVAMALFGTGKLIFYAPVLLLSAILTGLFTGLCARFALPPLRRAVKR